MQLLNRGLICCIGLFGWTTLFARDNGIKESNSSRLSGPKSSADESEEDVVQDGLINEVCDSNDFEIESPMEIFSLVLTF